jgi:hypothetical protein
VTPFVNQITATTPAAKSDSVTLFQVARSDTVSSLKAVLPAQASVLSLQSYRNGVSNAGTSATMTVTISNNTGVISTGTYDLKANGDMNQQIQMTNLPNLEPLPLLGDLQINAVYAETGTASSSGGPWIVSIRSAP